MSAETSAVDAEREPNFLLARWERPTLSWIARRLPGQPKVAGNPLPRPG
jgi:hypothetical protein